MADCEADRWQSSGGSVRPGARPTTVIVWLCRSCASSIVGSDRLISAMSIVLQNVLFFMIFLLSISSQISNPRRTQRVYPASGLKIAAWQILLSATIKLTQPGSRRCEAAYSEGVKQVTG